jgi:hypothetical protein
LKLICFSHLWKERGIRPDVLGWGTFCIFGCAAAGGCWSLMEAMEETKIRSISLDAEEEGDTRRLSDCEQEIEVSAWHTDGGLSRELLSCWRESAKITKTNTVKISTRANEEMKRTKVFGGINIHLSVPLLCSCRKGRAAPTRAPWFRLQ